MPKEVSSLLRGLLDAWKPRITLIRCEVSTITQLNIGGSSLDFKTSARTRLLLPRQCHAGEPTIRAQSRTRCSLFITLGSATILGRIAHTTISNSKVSSLLPLGRDFTGGVNPPSLLDGSVQEALLHGPCNTLLTTSRGGRGGISRWVVNIGILRWEGQSSYWTLRRRWRFNTRC